MIDSFYVWGSDGRMNLFFRPMGTVFGIEGREEDYVADEDSYIIQWEGARDYNSGYSEHCFPTYKEAMVEWNKIKYGGKHV